MNVAEVAPATGLVVVPELPWYHRYWSGAVPVAVTERVAVAPEAIVVLAGWLVIRGGVQAPAGGGVTCTPRALVPACSVHAPGWNARA